MDLEKVVDRIHNNNLQVNVYGLTRKYLSGSNNDYEDIGQIIYAIDTEKPRLDYYEYHVVEHCDLKCKRCGHYSNIAGPEFGDLEKYKNDLLRLKELYWGVGRIRLMGENYF